MIKFIVASLVLFSVTYGYSQENSDENRNVQISQKDKDISKFDIYCNENASYYTEVSKVKSIEFKRTISANEFAQDKTHVDYNITVLPEETQYFNIEGSTKMLVVKSAYLLKLEFNRTK